MSLIIGIGGASRSGKTSLARRLARRLRKIGSCVVLHQDDYIRPIPEIPLIRGEIDWEHPDSLDYAQLRDLVEAASIAKDFVIVEGFMLYPDKELTAMCDVHFFCEIDKATFLKRRRKDHRYGIDAEWYIEHVWDAFLKHGQPPPELEVYRLCKADNVMDILRASGKIKRDEITPEPTQPEP
ncbi:MAG: zeta toxin family protein [Saprospiraceae bacterium]|nr:zeta toxin family protein [Saprospiraceae bacterium]